MNVKKNYQKVSMKKILLKIISFLGQLNYVNVNDVKKISSLAELSKVEIVGDVKIEDFAKIINGVRIYGRISIGYHTSINGPNTDIICRLNEIQIGNYCSIARNVVIQSFNHSISTLSTHFISKNILNSSIEVDIDSKGGIEIGHDVWIGTGSKILSGVKIGNGAVIAANSVVTSDIPDFAVAGGIPAKVIKYRFSPEVIQRINEMSWWLWPREKVIKNSHLFVKKGLNIEDLEVIY